VKNENFETKIKPILDDALKLCEEEGIEFLAQFKLEGNQFYHTATKEMLLDGATIMNQYQKFAIRNESITN
jgi:hypothetical protein